MPPTADSAAEHKSTLYLYFGVQYGIRCLVVGCLVVGLRMSLAFTPCSGGAPVVSHCSQWHRL